MILESKPIIDMFDVKEAADDYINRYGDEAMLRLLAEECSELAHAALKMVRVMHGETPVTHEEAHANLVEELADVMLVGNMLIVSRDRIYPPDVTYVFCKKLERMKSRMTESRP